MKFRVGQEVEWVRSFNGKINKGLRGVVVDIDDPYIGVDWLQDIKGHACASKCKYGNGWYLTEKCLKLVKEVDPEYEALLI